MEKEGGNRDRSSVEYSELPITRSFLGARRISSRLLSREGKREGIAKSASDYSELPGVQKKTHKKPRYGKGARTVSIDVSQSPVTRNGLPSWISEVVFAEAGFKQQGIL